MDPNQQLSALSAKLLDYIDRAAGRFQEIKSLGTAADFYQEVKPFADEVKLVSEQWKITAVDWIIKNKPKYVHQKQIETAAENIEMISIQAFYPETSRTRFINHVQSVRYILNTLIHHE